MPGLDPELLSAAARRYKARVNAPADESFVLSTAQPSDRTSYLSRTLSKERAQRLSIDATAKGEPPRPDDTVQQIARERLVGSSDLVDFDFLELAIAMGR